MNEKRKIVGVFHTEQEVMDTIERLQAQGYRMDEISVIAKDRNEITTVIEERGTKGPEGVTAGAVTGGALGGIGGLLLGMGALAIPGIGPFIAAGPIVAGLTGMAVGAGSGSLIGGLIGLGFPEDEAKIYNDYLESGHILVLVDSDRDRESHVYDTFRTNNSLNASMYEDDYSYRDRNRDSIR